MALLFQSTLPVGGATIELLQRQAFALISIHAPRGGSDRPGRLQEPAGA